MLYSSKEQAFLELRDDKFPDMVYEVMADGVETLYTPSSAQAHYLCNDYHVAYPGTLVIIRQHRKK